MMKPLSLSVCTVLSVAASLAQLGNCPRHAFAAQPINLLPLGDSITAYGLYINPLMNTLTNNGYSPTLIANEGHGGYTIDMLRGNITTYLNHPNVNRSDTTILLMVGINDVSYYLMGMEDITTAPSRLGGLIGDIRANAPSAHLIVAQVSPDTAAGFDPVVRQFNQDIVPIVQSFGPGVSMVDMYTPFQPDPQIYLSDTVHPNQAGGDLMAGVWYQGIRAVSTPEPGTSSMMISLLVMGVVVFRKARLGAFRR